jgi:hypothetical protein
VDVPNIEQSTVRYLDSDFEDSFVNKPIRKSGPREGIEFPANDWEFGKRHQAILLKKRVLTGSTRNGPEAIGWNCPARMVGPGLLQQDNIGVQPL